MAAWIAGGVVVAGLVTSGIQSWMASNAQSSAQAEHKRVEKLNIKFAKQDSERQEKQFARTNALQQSGQNFTMVDSIIKNTQQMFQNNRAVTDNIVNYQRTRT